MTEPSIAKPRRQFPIVPVLVIAVVLIAMLVTAAILWRPPVPVASGTIQAFGDNGPGPIVQITLPSDAQQLAHHFPRFGQRRSSNIAGGWIAGVAITFLDPDGHSYRIVVDPTYSSWSEGSGDWPVEEPLELQALVDRLLNAGGPPPEIRGSVPNEA